MAHTITAEGGANLAPAAPAQIGAEGGANLAPSGPPAVVPEGSLGQGVLLGGTPTPDVTGFLPLAYLGDDGRPVFATGGRVAAPEAVKHLMVAYSSGRWRLHYYPTGTTGPRSTWIANAGTQAGPELAAGWTPDAGSDEVPGDAPTFTRASAPSGLTVQAEGGSNLAPTAPAQISGEGGASLSPSAPAQIRAESIY